MQPAPNKKKAHPQSIVTWLIVATVVIATLSAIAWAVIYFMGYTSSDTGKTQAGVASVLEPASTVSIQRTVTSELGVKVSYDARELEAYGYADETTYSSTDLSDLRAYSVIRVRPVATSEATRSNVTLASPELRVTSSVNDNYWQVLSKKEGYGDLSKIDMLVKETVDSRSGNSMTQASDAEVVEMGDVSYRKVSFITSDDRYGVTTERREDCYMSVQNDRPYVACINNIRPSNFAVTPQLEKVLMSTEYAPVKEGVLDAGAEAEEEALVDDVDDEVVESDVDEAKPEQQEKVQVPLHLSNSQDFRVLAGASPATVRVGTVYCADVRLTLPNGSEGPTLTGACVDRAGTGFFISRDGVIATAASAVRIKPQEAIVSYITDAPTPAQVSLRLERVLNYMVEARILMQTDAEALIAGVEERDQDIIAKVNELSYRIDVENISVTKEDYKYAVQLGDKPIVVSRNGDGSNSFTYTDHVVEAKYEASTYSTTSTQEQVYRGESPDSDVALLKISKQANYPVLPIGRPGEGVAEGSTVNIVGRPMYAFGSLETAQFRSTPMYRSAKVTETFTADQGQRLRAVSEPSHAGFAGAPVLGSSHTLVGVGTYDNANCPDRECFGSSVIRDTTGISELVRKRNLRIVSVSSSSEVWQKALQELTRGNYKSASTLFDEAARLYPQNYLAVKFAEYSENQYGTSTDTSTMNLIVRVLQTIVVLSGILLTLLAIVKIGLKLLLRPRIETQYGHMSGGEHIDPAQWQQQSHIPRPLTPPADGVPAPATWQPTPQQNPTLLPPQYGAQPQSYPPAAYQPPSQANAPTSYPPNTPPPSQ